MSSAAISVWSAIGASDTLALGGSVLGMHYDSLLAGFLGGLVALNYLPAPSLRKGAASVLAAVLLAGLFAPVAAVGALHYFPWMHGVGDVMRMVCGAALGLAGPALIPACLRRLGVWIGGREP